MIAQCSEHNITSLCDIEKKMLHNVMRHSEEDASNSTMPEHNITSLCDIVKKMLLTVQCLEHNITSVKNERLLNLIVRDTRDRYCQLESKQLELRTQDSYLQL